MFVYLIVAPQDCDIVEFPDGSRTVTARGGGAAVAESAADHPPAEEGSDEQRGRLEAAHRAWAERLDRALDASTSVTHARMIREAFVAEHPEPIMGVAVAEEAPHAQVSEGRWWCARIEHPDAGFDAWLADAGAPYPVAAVAHALSDLGARGWEMRHVAEDKRVVHDDASSRAELIGARFLLQQADA